MKKAFDPSNPSVATEWRDRFKAICLCKNMEELGLPSFIAQVRRFGRKAGMNEYVALPQRGSYLTPCSHTVITSATASPSW